MVEEVSDVEVWWVQATVMLIRQEDCRPTRSLKRPANTAKKTVEIYTPPQEGLEWSFSAEAYHSTRGARLGVLFQY